MKKAVLLLLALGAIINLNAQNTLNLDSLELESELEGIGVAKLDSDSLVSTFVIWIEDEVPNHRHNTHSETVIVLSGTANMTLGNEVIIISRGDYVFIPMGTPHSVAVTGNEPLKVISIQAPEFDGSDREAIKE